MNNQEKKQFVKSILSSLQEAVTKKINDMPEEWDGHEIRKFIADYYDCHYTITSAMIGKRKKDYDNTLTVSNLL